MSGPERDARAVLALYEEREQTKELLMRAVEACHARHGSLIVYSDANGHRVSFWGNQGDNGPDGRATTLTDALRALLAKVEAP